jgi:23S rRNA (cytosine1962-C5)-methyltransferase
MPPFPEISILTSPTWKDYELLDSGEGQKLERFGGYVFVRPEVQALWRKSLPAARWEAAHAVFQPTGEESGGQWVFRKKVTEKWEMGYDLTPCPPLLAGEDGMHLRFHAMTTPGRHLGVFPECAAHWDWISGLIHHRVHGEHREKDFPANPVVNVLNLFGYTGLATLAAAASGARVTHVDASKKSVAWARANAALSGLQERPIRWIVDDALKFIQREARRGVAYEGILLDPPKFGRGPKGEVWEVYKSLPLLLEACRAVLSEHPLFVALTVYAVKASALHLCYALEETMKGLGGRLDCGELVTPEKGAGRLLSQTVYARWEG